MGGGRVRSAPRSHVLSPNKADLGGGGRKKDYYFCLPLLDFLPPPAAGPATRRKSSGKGEIFSSLSSLFLLFPQRCSAAPFHPHLRVIGTHRDSPCDCPIPMSEWFVRDQPVAAALEAWLIYSTLVVSSPAAVSTNKTTLCLFFPLQGRLNRLLV